MTSNGHVEPEVLAAWAEGNLPRSEATAVEVHLGGCASCQEVLAVFARTEPAVPPAAPAVVSGFSWIRWRWAVPIAAAATAAAIWVATPSRDRAVDEFERTVAPAIEETPLAEASAPPAADAAAPVEAPKSVPSRKEAVPPMLSDRTDKAETRERQVREQDFAAVPQAAPAATPAAPPAAQGAPQAAEAAPAQARLMSAASKVVITSPKGTHFWQVLPGGVIERSIDRGQTWDRAIVDDPGPTNGASSPEETVCWIVGPSGRVLLTTDGLRFRRLPFPEKVDLAFVTATSATSAVVSTDGRRTQDIRFFRTDDQGKTWNPVQP